MMKLLSICVLISLVLQSAAAQDSFDFTELDDPYPVDQTRWAQVTPSFNASFVSADVKFLRSGPPSEQDLFPEWQAKAWRGEKVHTQALIWTTEEARDLQLMVSDLKDANGKQIDPLTVQANFMRYILTDHIGDLRSGCGIPAGLDTSLTADMIDTVGKLSIDARTSRPLWLSVHVPADASPGIYKGTLRVESSGKVKAELPFSVEVLKHVLPPPSEWSYHLDLWQNPFSVSRFYNLEPWSEAHFEAMKPYMQLLADAGQKNITASIIHDPWSGQTYDIYETMITWKKAKDGRWSYDYRVFDRWVEFMMSFGIDKFINCYSMIPWNLDFYYEDESTGKRELLKAKPQDRAYREHWKSMLVDFARHLKEKGWFDRTTIGMDERDMSDMKAAIEVIKEADPDFKVSLAGGDHPELYDAFADYSFASRHDVNHEVIETRRAKGYTTTFYTCCTEKFPNTFTSSAYAEAAWLSWYALKMDFDGYLRWAYNCWGPRPMQDARIGTWLAGDAWFVYPGARSSVRFERLIEGIQDFEKAKRTRIRLKDQGRDRELADLNSVIEAFELKALKEKPAADFVNRARELLNNLD